MARTKNKSLIGNFGAEKTENKGKIIGINDEGSKKQRKKRGLTISAKFSTYIYKVLKLVQPDLTISKQAMSVCESMVRDMFQRIVSEASNLSKINRGKTLKTRDIQTATRLVLPGELSLHAVSEGTKAVTRYAAS